MTNNRAGSFKMVFLSLIAYFVGTKILGLSMDTMTYLAVVAIGILVSEVYSDIDSSIQEMKDQVELLEEKIRKASKT